MASNLPTYSELGSLKALKENYAVEAKAAQGRRGHGAIPHSMWETYSAFANTRGGWILLGVEETNDGLAVAGLGRPRKLCKEIWDALQNRQKISANLLAEEDIQIVEEEGESLLAMRVPPATREDRPVYIDGNPMTGTYIRRHEGDYRLNEARVRRMLAEAERPARDSIILAGYSIEDLRAESLNAFRNIFHGVNPDHPFLEGDDYELLRRIGGIKRDRSAGTEGLSVAGLLMFGELHAIHDHFDHFFLDYQEREEDSSEGPRWSNRICTDGSGPQNLYDFYRSVSRRLTSNIKVPFRLDSEHRRVDDTEVHTALREALVNTLIHADYGATTPVQVLQYPSKFVYRNPGRLRVTKAQALEGGVSDCRNPNLQKMFQMIGAAEKAGSGVPKIVRAWRAQHWRQPNLEEDIEQDTTRLTLNTASLLPDDAVEALKGQLGQEFRGLGEDGRVILVTTHVEDSTTHERLMEVLDDTHPRDLTLKLEELVRKELLFRKGSGRGCYYVLPNAPEDPPESLGSKDRSEMPSSLSDMGPGDSINSPESGQHSPDSAPSSPDYPQRSPDSAPSSPDYPQNIPDSGSSPPDSEASPKIGEWQRLQEIARPVAQKGRASKKEFRQTILQLCDGAFRTPEELAKLLDRSKRYVQEHYLGPLVKDGLLEPRYPERKTHQLQAYRTVDEASSEG